MSLYYPTSIVYGVGQSYSASQDQGSTYLGSAYGDMLTFTPRLSITNPVNPSIITPTAANYPIKTEPFFMGSFDGFWVHKLYVGDRLVATIQTVNQEFFAPIYHDRIESVSMGTMELDPSIDYSTNVPAPSALVAIGIGVALINRKFNRGNTNA